MPLSMQCFCAQASLWICRISSRDPVCRCPYWCLRNKRPSKPYEFAGFGDVAVTKPYRFIWFGDIRDPKPYKLTGFRCPLLSQTPVVLKIIFEFCYWPPYPSRGRVRTVVSLRRRGFWVDSGPDPGGFQGLSSYAVLLCASVLAKLPEELRNTVCRCPYRCLRNMRPSKPYQFAGLGDVDVTKPYTRCYAIVLPGRKSGFRAGFWRYCYWERPKSALRPAFGRPESRFRCFPGSSTAKIQPGRPISVT
jgi:hypothetical protein